MKIREFFCIREGIQRGIRNRGHTVEQCETGRKSPKRLSVARSPKSAFGGQGRIPHSQPSNNQKLPRFRGGVFLRYRSNRRLHEVRRSQCGVKWAFQSLICRLAHARSFKNDRFDFRILGARSRIGSRRPWSILKKLIRGWWK